jgi:hypothetical protein
VADTFVGIQVGAISLVDEGVAPVLDLLVERAKVNAVLLSALSWSRGNAGRATTGFPDHGLAEPDELEGGAFFQPHERFYARTPIKTFPAPEPAYEGRDFLAELIPEAKRRGVAVYPYYCETAGTGHRPLSIPGHQFFLEIDHRGRKASRPCVNNVDYRTWISSIVEDWCRSYEIDGIVWGIERRGALLNLLWGDVATCFCAACRARAHERNVDVERAREGYVALDDYLTGVRGGATPRDGYVVEFLRVLMTYPEILAYEKLWRESHSEMHRELYGLVKWLDPNLKVGMHVWQVTNTYSPLLKAQYPYGEMVHYADFLKPVVYHTPAGSRFAKYLGTLRQTILKDGDPETNLRFMYGLLGLDEAPLAELPRAGFGAEYVRREVRRAVDGVGDRIPVYPGINVGVEVDPNGRAIAPADVKAAVTASFAGGAKGVTLSRNYSEARLENIAAVGEALDELGIEVPRVGMAKEVAAHPDW